jgi:hypothetical protein
MVMVLSRFSMNSAAATRAVICMARRCRSGSSSLRTRENQGLQSPIVRSFDHFIRDLPVGIRNSADRPGTWAGSPTGRRQLVVIELRL